MEDGHANNLALWLDPSVHYWGPIERFESVEVLRGTVITHGPNNNFGVINARNLSPFGPQESVVSAQIVADAIVKYGINPEKPNPMNQ